MTRQTTQTDKFKAIGEDKGITLAIMAESLSLTESAFIDKAERCDFNGSQLAKLIDLLELNREQINGLFSSRFPESTRTLKGVPFPINCYPFTTESIITLDDGSRWRKTTSITLEEVNND